jgi:hypothetical protein
MQLPKTNRYTGGLDAVAASGFIALFPAFVAYHYAVATHLVPPFAGGLFGITALVLSVAGALSLGSKVLAGRRETSALEFVFGALVVFLVGWTLAAVTILDAPYAGQAVDESLATLAIWLGVFFVGSHMRLPSDRWEATLAGSALLIGVLFAHAMLSSRSFDGPFILFGTGDVQTTTVSTYQGIGRSILAVSIVLAAARRAGGGQLLVLVAGAVALLSLGSRSHLFAALGLIACLALLLALRQRKHRVGVLAALLVVAGVSYALVEVFLETRASEVLDLAASTSWQARLEALAEAVSVIQQSPFLGSFGYHLGESSGYSHNALSAWAQYGLPGFLGYVALLLYALWISAIRAARASASALWLAAFQFNFVAILLAIVSEPIQASVFPALGWGVTAAALRVERLQRVRERAHTPIEAADSQRELRIATGH